MYAISRVRAVGGSVGVGGTKVRLSGRARLLAFRDFRVMRPMNVKSFL